jgi:hypothetical protein
MLLLPDARSKSKRSIQIHADLHNRAGSRELIFSQSCVLRCHFLLVRNCLQFAQQAAEKSRSNTRQHKRGVRLASQPQHLTSVKPNETTTAVDPTNDLLQQYMKNDASSPSGISENQNVASYGGIDLSIKRIPF